MFISWKVYFLINWELSTKHVDTYPYRRDFFWSLQKLHALPLLSCVFFHKKVGLCDVKIFLFIIESTFLHLQSITWLLSTYFLWLQFFHMLLLVAIFPCYFFPLATFFKPFLQTMKSTLGTYLRTLVHILHNTTINYIWRCLVRKNYFYLSRIDTNKNVVFALSSNN